jgi:hypothetical protein
MSYFLPNSVFLHIPKTGGSWVKRVIQRANLDKKREDGAWHSVQIVPGKFTFAFVRHPATWYQSVWAYSWKEQHWHGHHQALRVAKDRDFSRFIEKIISRFPKGFLGKFYEKWTQHCNFIGKYENMVEDTIKALKLAGEEFDENMVRDMESYTRNVAAQNPEWQKQCLYRDKELVARLLQTEMKVVRQYDYNYIPEGIVR